MADLNAKIYIEAIDRASKVFKVFSNNSKAAAKVTEEAARRAASEWRDIGDAAMRSGRAMLGLFRKPISEALSYSGAIAELQSQANPSAKSLQFMKTKADELSISFGSTRSELLLMFAKIASSGVEGEKNIEALGRASARLALAAGMTNKEAAGALVGAVNQFGLASTEADKVANLLSSGANAAETTILELSEALVKVGNISRTSGVSIERSVALLDQLALTGMKGAIAGTGLKTVFSRLLKPMASSQKIMRRLRVDMKKFNETPVDKRIALIGDKLKGLSTEKQGTILFTMFGTEGAAAAASLMGTTAEQIDLVTKAIADKTALDRKAKAKLKDHNVQLAIMQRRLEGVYLKIGNSVLKFFDKHKKKLNEIVVALDEFISRHPTLLKWLVIIFGSAGIMFTAFGTMAMMIASIKGMSIAFGLLRGKIIGLFVIQKLIALWTAFNALALVTKAQMIFIAAGFAAWAYVIHKLSKELNDFSDIWIGLKYILAGIYNDYMLPIINGMSKIFGGGKFEKLKVSTGKIGGAVTSDQLPSIGDGPRRPEFQGIPSKQAVEGKIDVNIKTEKGFMAFISQLTASDSLNLTGATDSAGDMVP